MRLELPLAPLRRQLKELPNQTKRGNDEQLERPLNQLKEQLGQKGHVVAQLKERIAELRQSRAARRAARLAALESQHGASQLSRPEVRAELQRHARRVARLKRALIVADESKQPKQRQRAEQLLSQERRRHAAALHQLFAPKPASKQSGQAR